MRMFKRISVVLFFVAACSSVLFAQNGYRSRSVDIRNMESLEIYSNFDVRFEKSDDCRIVLEIPEEYEKCLVVRTGEKVSIGFDGRHFSRAARKIFSTKKPVARVYAPTFRHLNISGAVKMVLAGDFEMKKVGIEISGAAELNEGTVRADEMDLKLSGASQCELQVRARTVGINTSGASFAKLLLSVENLIVESSGASDIVLEPQSGSVGMNMCLALSGAADLKARNLPFERIQADLSGASAAIICPLKAMQIEASGASRLRYVKSGHLSTEVNSTSGSSIKSL